MNKGQICVTSAFVFCILCSDRLEPFVLRFIFSVSLQKTKPDITACDDSVS